MNFTIVKTSLAVDQSSQNASTSFLSFYVDQSSQNAFFHFFLPFGMWKNYIQCIPKSTTLSNLAVDPQELIEALCLDFTLSPHCGKMPRLLYSKVLRPITQFRSISRNSIVSVASNSVHSSEKGIALPSTFGKARNGCFSKAVQLNSKRFLAHYDKPKNIDNYVDEDDVPMIREYIETLIKIGAGKPLSLFCPRDKKSLHSSH